MKFIEFFCLEIPGELLPCFGYSCKLKSKVGGSRDCIASSMFSNLIFIYSKCKFVARDILELMLDY